MNKTYDDFEYEARKYDNILKKYEKNGEVFTDYSFHPNCPVTETKVTFEPKETIWERIDKYYAAPLFKKEAICEAAIQQGELGTCYFIASLSRIARQPELVEMLFDTRTKTKTTKKKGKKGEYVDTINLKCGAVIVYFHVFGRRTPVLIDTLIPFKRGTRKPKFSHPSDLKYSPWFCLIEKAYAKLNGSYSSIAGGQLSKAIYSLFGYFPCYNTFAEVLKKREAKLEKESEKNGGKKKKEKFDETEYLFSKLMSWQHDNAVLGADISLEDMRSNITEDEIIDNGLVTNHSYLVMKVRREQGKNFICLRNPWGDHEWLGDWSDTSQLWTPELKKKLGVHSKDDGTFWMIDKDFFKYFTSFDVAKPVNPEFHCKSYKTRLEPGQHDGYPLDSSLADLEHHQTFHVKLKNVRIRTYEGEQNSEIEIVDKVKVYIRVERISPLFDESTNTLYERPKMALYTVFSDGKKLEFDKIEYYNRQWISSKSAFLATSIEVDKNESFVLVLHRLDKWKFTEDCYVQVICKYDFDLYDVDYPSKLMKEDEKFDIVFNNKSKRYSNIAKNLRVKSIDGKDIQAFATLNTMDLTKSYYKNYRYMDEENDSGLYEYSISESMDSSVDTKAKKKNDKKTKSELKEINDKKKEIQQLEKKIQEEKEKIESVKKQIDEEKEEMKKAIEELDLEKKQLEDEKKKSKKVLEEELHEDIEEKDDEEEEEEKPKPSMNKNLSQKKSAKNIKADDDEKSKKNVSKKSTKIAESDDEEYSGSESNSDRKQLKKKKTNESDESAPKKQKKTIPKKTNKKAASNVSDYDSSEEPRRRTINRKSKAQDSDSDSDENEEAPKKKVAKNAAKSPNRRNVRNEASDSSDTSSETPQNARRNQKGKKAAISKKSAKVSDDDDDQSADSDRPKARRAKRKISPKASRNDSDDSDDSESDKPRKKQRNAKRKTSDSDPSEENSDIPKRKVANRTNKKNANLRNKRKQQREISESDSESEPPKSKAKSGKVNNRNPLAKRKNSDDSSSEPVTKKAKSGRVQKNKRIISSGSSSSENDSVETPKRRRLNNRARGGKSKRRVESESESSDSDQMKRKKPANARKTPSGTRKVIYVSSESDSEFENKNRGRNNMKKKNLRGKSRQSDESSDSVPTRKKLANRKKVSSDDSDDPKPMKRNVRRRF